MGEIGEDAKMLQPLTQAVRLIGNDAELILFRERFEDMGSILIQRFQLMPVGGDRLEMEFFRDCPILRQTGPGGFYNVLLDRFSGEAKALCFFCRRLFFAALLPDFLLVYQCTADIKE